MGLPKIDLPIFELTLPSSGDKIKYRPFTVKEEKILLVAQQSDDPSQEVLAVKQIVNNCLIEKEVGELAMFDLEYVMLILRARSVDNNIEFSIKDPDTDESVKLKLDLEDVKITKDETHTKEIPINSEYTLFLKYPTIDEYIQLTTLPAGDPLGNYYMMISCLEKIASEDEIHYLKDYKPEEIDEFVENLAGETVKGIQTFFETVPKLRHELKYTNSNGDEKTFVIEGMQTFFS